MYKLKDNLDFLVEKYETADFIRYDPIQFPHRFTNKQDIEVAGFLASTLSFGRRQSIIKACDNLFNILGESPYQYVMTSKWKEMPDNMHIYRFVKGRDIKYICRGLRYAYQRSETNSLESYFTNMYDPWLSISLLHNIILIANKGETNRNIVDPQNGSACKRWHMFLRWMVRKLPVDLGIWTSISPSKLIIPIDTHVLQQAIKLNIIPSTSKNTRETAQTLTLKLKKLNQTDPARYDFALFGMGVQQQTFI